jgi:hypothetical protein
LKTHNKQHKQQQQPPPLPSWRDASAERLLHSRQCWQQHDQRAAGLSEALQCGWTHHHGVAVAVLWVLLLMPTNVPASASFMYGTGPDLRCQALSALRSSSIESTVCNQCDLELTPQCNSQLIPQCNILEVMLSAHHRQRKSMHV